MVRGPRRDVEEQHQEAYIPLPVNLTRALGKKKKAATDKLK